MFSIPHSLLPLSLILTLSFSCKLKLTLQFLNPAQAFICSALFCLILTQELPLQPSIGISSCSFSLGFHSRFGFLFCLLPSLFFYLPLSFFFLPFALLLCCF